jgi:flagellar biosynthesis protein FlhA
LLIVNFVVINKGATRMAEVGARFALDGMPGKQLAIDSDVNAGAITHDQARERREQEQAETTFFGSLDGASKFVKGDAVAGLLITGLNLVMGLIIGIAVHGMPASQAFETYAILTVGDGLVSQIPAVIISIASALLLARGGASGATDLAVFGQLGKHPSALLTVAVLMALFALVPGLPFIPFILGALALGGTAYWIKSRPEPESVEPEAPDEVTPKSAAIGDVLDLDDIHVEFAPDLVEMVLDPATGLDARITNMRQHVAENFGVLLPEIRLTDNAALGAGTYVIRVQGVEQVRDTLRPGRVLALLSGPSSETLVGEDVQEPVYGAPARWIDSSQQQDAAVDGLTTVLPTEVLATHLLEVIKRNFPRIMTLRALRRLLDAMVQLTDQSRSEANRKMLDELIPDKVPVDLLLSVLRLLLDERVSIRNLPVILEAISEARAANATPDLIADHVRQRLGFQIVSGLKRQDGTIPLVQLSPEWEDRFTEFQILGDRGVGEVALPPDLFNQLANAMSEKLASVAETGTVAAVVTTQRRRRFLRSVLASKGIENQVLSIEELGLDARPALVGLVAA